MYETLFVFGLDKFIKTYQAFRLRCLPRSPLLQFFDLRGLQKPRRCGAPNGFRSALGCEGLDRGGRCEELQHSEVQETPILSDSPKADRCHVLVLCQGCVCVSHYCTSAVSQRGSHFWKKALPTSQDQPKHHHPVGTWVDIANDRLDIWTFCAFFL